MKRLFILFVLLVSIAKAQAPWAPVLDPSRAIDWTQSSGLFTIPSGSWSLCVTAACNTLTAAGTSATVAQVNAAIASAPANSVVKIGSGLFTMSSCIDWAGHSHVALRGNGPTNTIVKFSGSCFGYSGNATVNMRAASNTFDRSAANSPGGSNALNITGTAGSASGGPTGAGLYPQGATQIVVASVGSDTPKVGTVLFTDQADDLSPFLGWLQCTTNNTTPACNDSGGTNNGRLIGGVGYNQVQAVRITSCNGSSVLGTSCGAATTYTISPGLYATNIRTSQSPGAWWNFSSNLCTQCGIEAMTLDTSAITTLTDILIYDCYQCWVQNTRLYIGGSRTQIYEIQSLASVVRDSYIFGSVSNSSGGGYGIDIVESSDGLIENNTFEKVDTPIIFEDGSGFILSANFNWNNIFVNPNWMQISYGSHDNGNFMNLWTWNDFSGISHDTTNHGGSPVISYFRNKFNGNQQVPNDKTQATVAVEMQVNNEAENFVGNVLGIVTCVGGPFAGRPADEDSQCGAGGTATGPPYHNTYQTSPGTSGTNCYFSLWSLGWASADCANTTTSGVLHANVNTENTMVRWANWDTVTGASGPRYNSTEASPGAGTFINANFSQAYFNTLSHTLPASWHYNSQPSWWPAAIPYPPIGPDVTGGNLSGLGGHAYIIPIRSCWENAAQDNTNYPGTVVRQFDITNCNTAPSGPSLSIVPSPGAFGNQNIYSTSSTLTLTVSNVGSGVENLSSVYYSLSGSNSNDFQVVGGTCSSSGTIAAGGSCTMVLTFIPNVLSAESSTITVLGTVNGSVNLTGTGVQPQGNHACIITGPVAELGICN